MSRVRIPSPSGSRLEERHGYIVGKDGAIEFTVVEEIDITTKINAAAVGSSLYEMISKYLKTGDDSFLYAKANAFNADLTQLPQNLIELHNIKSTCTEDFKKFPVEYRKLFDFDVNKYFKAIQDNSIKDITDKYFESKKAEKKEVEPVSE